MLRMLKKRRGIDPGESPSGRFLLRPSPDVLTAERDGVAVLLDLRREIYLGLDEVGTRIWQGIEGGDSPDRIAARIADEFDAPHDAVLADTHRFVEELAGRKLLVRR